MAQKRSNTGAYETARPSGYGFGQGYSERGEAGCTSTGCGEVHLMKVPQTPRTRSAKAAVQCSWSPPYLHMRAAVLMVSP